MPFFRNHRWLILLIFLAFLTRFLFLWHPAEVVFDEVHFGKFVSSYSTGQYYFDIHPPLGKLLIAGWAKIWGFRGSFDFEKIGEGYNARTLFVLRFLPALFGALFVLAVYKFAALLTGSKRTGLIAGFLTLFDNAFLVESKFILVDSMLFFFGLLALYLFILSQKANFPGRSFLFMALSGLAFGAAISVKWTGLAAGMMILLFLFLDIFRKKRFFSSMTDAGRIGRRMGRFVLKALVFLGAAGLIYISGFYLHFSLLTKSGPGDAFMTPGFQKTLQGNSNQNNDFARPNFWKKFAELNKIMFTANAGLKATHPFSSQWYQWPLARRPIYYWAKPAENPGGKADIWLIGNPLSWLLALLAVSLTILGLLFKSGRNRFGEIVFSLILAYLVNLLPFIFISRVAFLYHYLPALTFGFVLLALKIDRNLKQKKSLIFFFTIIILFFLVLAPISYGFPAPKKILDLSQMIINLFS